MSTNDIWARIDVGIVRHPDCLEAGEDATNLHIRGILYCREYLTDGRIPKSALRTLSSKKTAFASAASLVKVGLWIDACDVWEVRDFLQRNPSKDEVKSKRDAALDRKRRWKERNGNASGTRSSGVPDASAERSGNGQTQTQTQAQRIEPPFPPAGAGAPPAGKRERKARVMTPDAEQIRARIAEATGAAPHPPSAFDKLLRGFETAALTVDDAEVMVAYLASDAADGYWRKRGMPPQYVFAPRHVAEILPLARGWRAGTLRTQHRPSVPSPYRLVSD